MEKRNFYLKMNLACGDCDFRPVMQHVYFENGNMYATDAHILVKAAVLHHSDFDQSEVDLLEGKFIHKQTFKKILSCKMVQVVENGIKDLATNDIYSFSNVENKYPNINTVIPTSFSKLDEIGLNPKYLKTFSQIFTGKTLLFKFSGQNKPITVKIIGEHSDTMTGIIMPVMLTE